MKTRSCTFMISPEVHREIKKAAEAEERSVSSWLRKAAKEKLQVGVEA